jgi:hypothetical protein
MKIFIPILLIMSIAWAVVSCTQNTTPPRSEEPAPVELQPDIEAIPANAVHGINGPGWLYSGTLEHFQILSDSPEGIEYTFSCVPPEAGIFEPGSGIFTPAEVTEPTDINIVLDFNLYGQPGSYQLDVKVYPELDGWARQWGRTRIKDIFGPATDGSGNLYVSGIFDERCDFDPDLIKTDERESVRLADCFLSKFSPDGDIIWTSTWGSYDADRVVGVVTDNAGNSYVAGPVTDAIFFGPVEESTGYGVDGNSGGYLAKFSTDGVFQWVKMWGSAIGMIDVTTVGLDNSGNPYVAGTFSGDADFRPGDEIVGGVSRGFADAFISKFSSNGNHLWTTSWGGSHPDVDVSQPNTLAFDGANNVYAVGIYQGEMIFGPSRGFGGRENVHLSNGASDIFLIKLKSDGFTDWEKVWGGPFDDYGIGLLASSRGLYVTGSVRGPVDFVPGSGIRQLEPPPGGLGPGAGPGPGGPSLGPGGTGSGPGGIGLGVGGGAGGGAPGPGGNGPGGNGPGARENEPGNMSDINTPSTFLARYSYGGSLGFAKTWGDGAGFALTEDNQGNVIVTGYANGDFVIGEGEDRQEIPGTAFVAKFGSDGEYVWGRAWGQSDTENGSGVVSGAGGNIYVTGLASGNIFWDPDNGFSYSGMVENPSAFLIKFLPDGSW